MRLALKLATGAGKTTVMAMLIAWQTVNAVRKPTSRNFSRGFLIVAPGLTIRDRLRVLQPNDPDSYYMSRELVPNDMLGDIERAKIVITNYHTLLNSANAWNYPKAAVCCCKDVVSSLLDRMNRIHRKRIILSIL
jgi:hypothetical protein